ASEINVADLLVQTNLFSSKGEVRRMIEQGGVTIDNEKVTDINLVLSVKQEYIIKKGKKNFLKITNK
ncbi:MAG: tyrosine--tRNA ligase, partial [Clostridia bacterium]|nr:tyrosine--tRNA ligase [Clostridia bacterium]